MRIKQKAIPKPKHPVHLDYYRRKYPEYLPQITDHNLICGVILKTALRRRQWPDAFGIHHAWIVKHEPDLAVKLEDIGISNNWFGIVEAKYIDYRTGEPFQATEENPTPWAIEVALFPQLCPDGDVSRYPGRHYASENFYALSRALPRLRSLGRMIQEERLAAEGANPDLEGGGGGQKPISAPPEIRDQIEGAEDAEFFDDSEIIDADFASIDPDLIFTPPSGNN